MKESKQIADQVFTILDDHKALEPVLLDIRTLSSIADYMVICHGTSARHAAALASHVLEDLKTDGVCAIGTEGEDDGEWILLDYDVVLVHIMQQKTREFYNLEGLWIISNELIASNSSQN